MALTYTPSGELGSLLPTFSLTAVDGKTFSSEQLGQAKALMVMFICNHCPYVKAIEDRLIVLAREFLPRQVGFAAICSNDPTAHPDDAPEALRQRWLEKKYPFPYLIDGSQDVARAFAAVCTPDLFVYDAHRKLRYRGRLDDSWRNPRHVLKQELRTALVCLLQNLPVPEAQNSCMGCSIKWKNGD